jgi:tRNA A-37 threonylcarbamoyl transferase component Bud32
MELTQHAEGGQVLVSDSVVAAIVAQHPKADFDLRFRTVGAVPVEPHDTLDSADRAQAVGAFDMRPHAECPTYEHERESVERCPPGRHLQRIAIGSGNACKYIVNYEDLTLSDQPVGEGGYGWVYRGRWHGVEVAVKLLARKRFGEESRLQFREEASLLARLRHPHVVLFIGVCLRSPNACIVTEWLPRGSLRDVLDDQTQELDWPLRLSLVRGVALGLAYLHSFAPAILHRDLNSSNVLIDDLWNAKITGNLADNGLLSFSLLSSVAHDQHWCLVLVDRL